MASNSTYAASDAALTNDAKRKPDWNEFYKNGVPAEIIVIDDDTPPPNGPRRQNGHAAATAAAAAAAATSTYADKRQRTGNAYDPVYNQQQTTYSATQTPYYENSASTDRTTSAYVTTAPTSLGSTTSNGATYLPPLEDGTVGQKRKRTRAQVADDAGPGAKRREVERLTPPHMLYIPPEKPIVKAKEVHVEVIRDVCGCTPSRRKSCAHTKQKQNANERFDDEDGHYNVVAGANLTERCRFELARGG
jgi:dual-specificity kinase